MTLEDRVQAQRLFAFQRAAALGIDDLVLDIHDPSFPSAASEDIGRGSPYSRGNLDFLRYLRGLGFGGIQFGPQQASPRRALDQRSERDGELAARWCVRDRSR